MRPTISVIIATYYRNDLVQEAIESVLAQAYEPVELIVVDDSGEGHAAEILDQYDLTAIIRQENGDWAAAYQTGIEASSGEYVHFLDDDDYFLEGKLEKTAQVLERDPTVGVAFSGVRQDTLGDVHPDPGLRGDILERALRFRTFPLCTISMLMERDVLLDTLPLPTFADDINLKIELAQRTRFDYVDECLVYRRKEAGRKWQGRARIEEMKAVIEHHQDLYAQYPAIHRGVRAETYVREADQYLSERMWSPRAIACFARAAALSDAHRAIYLGRLAGSLFGRPGMRTLRWAHTKIEHLAERKGAGA